jgi:hypothetical protein
MENKMKNDYNWIEDCADEISDLTNYNQDMISSIIRRHLNLNKTPIELKFYYMYDNHTYERLRGETLDEIINHACNVEFMNPYGMLCKPTIIYSDKSERKVGEPIHSTSEGFNPEELDNWRKQIEADKEVMGFFK